MSRHRTLVLAISLLLPSGAWAQTPELELYLSKGQLKIAFDAVAARPPDLREPREIIDLLPQNRVPAFVQYVIATRPALALRLESLRLNKILENGVGAGGTSSVSSAIGPALLGAAIEYGGVLQESTGTTTTLRANLAGVARLAVGSTQFPYCPAIDPAHCNPWSRRLRRVSGMLSFEQRTPAATAPAGTPTPTPTSPSTSDLLGSNYRVSSWGTRVELTRAGRLDDPKYTAAWTKAVGTLTAGPEPAAFTAAIADLFGTATNLEIYSEWRVPALAALQAAKTDAEFQEVFNRQLQTLVDTMLDADDSFATRIFAAARAFNRYVTVRDDLIMQAQVHKSSLEYTNRTPLGQPGTSNVRFIYSHQPTAAPLVLTLNAALSAYNNEQAEVGRLRDVQLAGQLDRQLGQVPNLGKAVLTLAVYYQWMKEDAVVDITKSVISTLPGLELADGTATVLGTKGHIVLVQGKVSLPINDVLKVPFSVTWSNRRELIPDTHTVRGQIGLAIDLDGVFK